MEQHLTLKVKVFLIITLCITSAHGAAAQSQTRLFDQRPYNCEGNSLRLDLLRNKSISTDQKKIIAIARLGTGESSRELNRRRLYTVRAYLTAMGLFPQSLVTAEGDRVRGFGRIDVYVGGDLVEVLPVDRCKDLPVGICDNSLEDRRLYQLPKKRKVDQCR